MSCLVAVSNRVPSLTDAPPAGGLCTALKSALEDCGGVWFGWSGQTHEAPPAAPQIKRMAGYDLATIDLTSGELRGYYEQHANRALWPLLHGRLDLTSFEHACYALYRKVNRRFARALAPLIEADDVIWVHDYHLIPLGLELRKLGVSTPIGFFLHTPFPAPDTLAAFPWCAELLDQLGAYDLVGFQTKAFLRNFHEANRRYAHANSNADHYAIGIDTDAFATRAVSPAAQRHATRLKRCMADQLCAVGVERLDYTKGIAERFEAFEILFDRAPDLVGRLSLVQIAAPSRESVSEYQDMQATLAALSGRINAHLGRLDWIPIRYINRASNQDQLAALYRFSRIGVVTPLCDGMNLVAKEYVAAQDPDDPGILILSQFAGASEAMTEALLVNPYDKLGMAQALRRAAKMPLTERQERWQPMMERLRRHDVHRWWRDFLNDLTNSRRTPDTISTAVA